MKTILPAVLLVACSATHAQSAKPPSCDDLQGLEKEACLKKGGTVKANTAGSGSSAAPKPSERSKPVPAAKKDYARPDSK